MNFIPSLILYNPLESFIFINLILIVNNNKLSFKKLIINSYLLGFLNLIPQYILELFYGYKLYMLFTIIVQFILLPTISCFYIENIINIRNKRILIYIYRIIYSFSTLLIGLILNYFYIFNLFDLNYIIKEEICINLLTKFIQLSFIYIIYIFKKGVFYEKEYLKKDGRE